MSRMREFEHLARGDGIEDRTLARIVVIVSLSLCVDFLATMFKALYSKRLSNEFKPPVRTGQEDMIKTGCSCAQCLPCKLAAIIFLPRVSSGFDWNCIVATCIVRGGRFDTGLS